MTVDGQVSRSPARAVRVQEEKRRSTFWPVLFILTLALPVSYYVAAMRLSPYRLVLLVMLVPCLIQWASGKAGKIRSFDIFLLLYVVWCAISMFVTILLLR